MNDKNEMPADVVAAINANNKIEAIKLLREQRNIGLKEAKDAVEAYIGESAAFSQHAPAKSGSGMGRWIIIALVLTKNCRKLLVRPGRPLPVKTCSALQMAPTKSVSGTTRSTGAANK